MVTLLSMAITPLSMINSAAASHKSSATAIRARRWVNLRIGSVVLGLEHHISAIELLWRGIDNGFYSLVWMVCWCFDRCSAHFTCSNRPWLINIDAQGVRWGVRRVFVSIWQNLHFSPLLHLMFVVSSRRPFPSSIMQQLEMNWLLISKYTIY